MKDVSNGVARRTPSAICLGAALIGGCVTASQVAWAQTAPLPLPPETAALGAPFVVAPPHTDYTRVKVGVGLRLGSRFQNPSNPGAIDDFGLDEGQVGVGLSGDVTSVIAWQVGFNASIPTNSNGGMGGYFGGPGGNGAGTPSGPAILNLIGKLDLHDTFHLWVGRMVVPSDRSNFSGPWFIAAGRYPGTSFPTYLGPRTGPHGRDNGVTAWGELGRGKIKYYLGALQLNDATISPLYAGRLNIALVGSEPGYHSSSTYYGAQDIMAVGGGFQYQNNSAVNATGANHTVFNVDLLAERNFGPVGVFSLEAAYYHYPAFAGTILTSLGTSVPVVRHHYFLLVSYLTPEKVGMGRLNPLLRWQQSASPDWKVFDAFLTYVMDGHSLRSWVGYERTDFGSGSTIGNAVLLGLQMQR